VTIHRPPSAQNAEYGRLVVGSTQWIDAYITTVRALFGQVDVERLPKMPVTEDLS
jgi:hypothetical protein